MSQAFNPLVAAVIHDAKNALQVLDTRLEAASCRPASADFSAARADVVRIARQLTELLTLFRAENGELRLSIADQDLTDFLADLLGELGSPPNGIQIDVDYAGAARIGAWAFDAYLLRLALLDALRNAFRHAKRRVSLTLDLPPGGGIRFGVSDDGPGYAADILAGTGQSPDRIGSTGLGLNFARLIAGQHTTPSGRHGSIELSNHAGAILRIFLP